MRKNRLFFKKNGMPRWYVQRILFSSDKVVRPRFRRVVYRKNGLLRPIFQTWAAQAYGASENASVQQETPIPKLEILQSLRPLEDVAASWRHGKAPENPLSADEISSVLAGPDGREVLLCVSHDNYRKIQGGVQLCIRREEQMAVEKGVGYLNIHPWQPYPRLAHLEDESNPFVSLVWNGKAFGTARISDLTAAVRKRASEDNTRFNVTVHQLMGHNPEQITALAQASGAEHVFVWLHDFFTLCPSARLTRNNMAFCGAPALDSNACGLCVYGQERQKHFARMTDMFNALAPTFISPSTVTADLWKERAAAETSDVVVLPHLTLEWNERDTALPIAESKKFKVGFLGTAEPHKGWSEFERLSEMSGLSNTFEFVALTVSKVKFDGKHVPVRVTDEAPNAMAQAVVDQELDLVLHWPDWPETFALTAFEALEGGAYLITNSGSGNVAAAVERVERGTVLETEKDLIDFFENGGAEALAKDAREARRTHHVTRHQSALSLDLMKVPA